MDEDLLERFDELDQFQSSGLPRRSGSYVRQSLLGRKGLVIPEKKEEDDAAAVVVVMVVASIVGYVDG